MAFDQSLSFAGHVLRRCRPHFGLLNLPLEFAASLFLVEVKEPVSLDVEVGGWELQRLAAAARILLVRSAAAGNDGRSPVGLLSAVLVATNAGGTILKTR